MSFQLLQIYRDRPITLNLDSARQSQIEAQRSERGSPFPVGKGDEEDRFGEVAASPNSKLLAGRGIKATEEIALPIRGKKSRLTRQDLFDYFGLERLGISKSDLERELSIFEGA